jgi:Ca2+-binding RTX toxin-like protein
MTGVVADGVTCELVPGGYVADGASADAPDAINGDAADETLLGLGGNDGLPGGAGNDFSEGSAIGQVDRPVRVDFVPPASSGVEVARGFSWVIYNPPGADAGGSDSLTVAGAGISPRWLIGNDVYVEASGNVIDGGAGLDFIYAGTGDDTVRGGEDADDIIGMRGRDYLFGDGGDDRIVGDGPDDPNQVTLTRPEHHGNDVLDGGAGNDTLIGEGDDQLRGDNATSVVAASSYCKDTIDGGEGNDLLWGDGGDFAERRSRSNTPIRGISRVSSSRNIRRLTNAANDGAGSRRIAA